MENTKQQKEQTGKYNFYFYLDTRVKYIYFSITLTICQSGQKVITRSGSSTTGIKRNKTRT